MEVDRARAQAKLVGRVAFAAKLRVSRAVLGWSQTELGHRVGLSQRAVHKIEQAETEPRPPTVRRIEEFWGDMNLYFEDCSDGGLRLTVHASALLPRRSRKLGVAKHLEKLRLLKTFRCLRAAQLDKVGPRMVWTPVTNFDLSVSHCEL